MVASAIEPGGSYGGWGYSGRFRRITIYQWRKWRQQTVDVIALRGRTLKQKLRWNKNGWRAYAFVMTASLFPSHHRSALFALDFLRPQLPPFSYVIRHSGSGPAPTVSAQTPPSPLSGSRRPLFVSGASRSSPERLWSPVSPLRRFPEPRQLGYEVAAGMCGRCNLNGPPGGSDRAEVRTASCRRKPAVTSYREAQG